MQITGPTLSKGSNPTLPIMILVLKLDSLEEIKNKVNQKINENNKQTLEESNAYSLFAYAIRSQVTRDYYLRRLRIFFTYINLQPHSTIEERCNYFADMGINDPTWAFNCIVRLLQYQKERDENN